MIARKSGAVRCSINMWPELERRVWAADEAESFNTGCARQIDVVVAVREEHWSFDGWTENRIGDDGLPRRREDAAEVAFACGPKPLWRVSAFRFGWRR